MLAWLTPDSLPEAGDVVCRPLLIPNNQRVIAAVNGALLTLCEAVNWESFGAVSPKDMAYRMLQMFEAWAVAECADPGGDFMPLGVPFSYITADPPAGCVACDGNTYLDTDYPAIWAVLDDAWKVDGSHWRVPDMRGRFPIGAAASYPQGEEAGEADVTLTIAEMPSHGHIQRLVNGAPHSYNPGAVANRRITAMVAGDGIAPYVETLTTGLGQSHNNIPPYVALKWAIRVE